MANKGSYLKTNEVLIEGDYLASPNGLFFAILQDDGHFCVYKGRPNDNRGGMWCSKQHPGPGEYFLVMQDDGNLCVYKGTPGNDCGGVWCSFNENRPDDNQSKTPIPPIYDIMRGMS